MPGLRNHPVFCIDQERQDMMDAWAIGCPVATVGVGKLCKHLLHKVLTCRFFLCVDIELKLFHIYPLNWQCPVPYALCPVRRVEWGEGIQRWSEEEDWEEEEEVCGLHCGVRRSVECGYEGVTITLGQGFSAYKRSDLVTLT